MMTMNSLLNWNIAKQHLRDRLLTKAVAEKVRGLIIQYVEGDIFRSWHVDMGDNRLAPVTGDLLRAWGIEPADLVTEVNSHNAGRVVRMSDIVGGGTDATPTYVVTTEDGTYGAAAILYKAVQEQLDQFFPAGYIVLPSSIHEVICVAKDAIDVTAAAKMVREINDSIVSDTDRLSDNVFVIRDGFLAVAA